MSPDDPIFDEIESVYCTCGHLNEDHLDFENYYIYEVFLEDLDKWIYSKLDLDIILDMISSKGIDSLREVDKRFLKENYTK